MEVAPDTIQSAQQQKQTHAAPLQTFDLKAHFFARKTLVCNCSHILKRLSCHSSGFGPSWDRATQAEG